MHGPRIGIAQVPNKPVHPCCFRKRLLMPDPILRHKRSLFRLFRHRRAGKTPYQFFVRFVNFQLNVSGGIRGQKIIQYRAVRGILPRGNFRRQRRILIFVAPHPDGRSRRKQMSA